MPRLIHRLPQIRLHSPSGRARVRINGKDFWLGPFGSPAAIREYDRLIAKYLANGRQIPSDPSPPDPSPPDPSSSLPASQREKSRESPVPIRETAPSLPASVITITTLIARFTEHADSNYRHPSGEPTREAENFKHVTRPLRKMFGTLPVADFGPNRLIAFREQLIKQQLARRTINRMMGRLRTIFRWGVSRELVPVDVLSRLQTVEPLQPNRGGRETSGTRGPVSWEVVQKTLDHLPPLIRSLVVVAFHSGARVGELAKLTTRMIDMTSDPWIAILDQHKTRHKGKSRRIYLGPSAQAALLPWLLDDPDAVIFSPRRVDDRQEKRRGKRLPGRYYGRSSLQQTLRRAIERAGVEHWSLGQLRHSAACRITDEFDLEATRQVLGHSTVSMSRHYSQGSDSAAKKAAKKIG
jgi:integrase